MPALRVNSGTDKQKDRSDELAHMRQRGSLTLEQLDAVLSARREAAGDWGWNLRQLPIDKAGLTQPQYKSGTVSAAVCGHPLRHGRRYRDWYGRLQRLYRF